MRTMAFLAFRLKLEVQKVTYDIETSTLRS